MMTTSHHNCLHTSISVQPPTQLHEEINVKLLSYMTGWFDVPLSSGTATPVRRLLTACVTELMNINNMQHLLYCLLPSQREQHYELRQRVHNLQHRTQSSSLLDSNYFMRMLFKNTGCALSTACIIWHFITVLDMLYYFLLYWHYLAAFCLLFYVILMNDWMIY